MFSVAKSPILANSTPERAYIFGKDPVVKPSGIRQECTPANDAALDTPPSINPFAKSATWTESTPPAPESAPPAPPAAPTNNPFAKFAPPFPFFSATPIDAVEIFAKNTEADLIDLIKRVDTIAPNPSVEARLAEMAEASTDTNAQLAELYEMVETIKTNNTYNPSIDAVRTFAKNTEADLIDLMKRVDDIKRDTLATNASLETRLGDVAYMGYSHDNRITDLARRVDEIVAELPHSRDPAPAAGSPDVPGAVSPHVIEMFKILNARIDALEAKNYCLTAEVKDLNYLFGTVDDLIVSMQYFALYVFGICLAVGAFDYYGYPLL